MRIKQEDIEFITNISAEHGKDLSDSGKIYYSSVRDNFPDTIELIISGKSYSFVKKKWEYNEKSYSLRYGTNPSQAGAFYVLEGSKVLNWNFVKIGKNGPSSTNIEDINQAVEILKYFEPDRPASIIMKHLIPSGFMVGNQDQDLHEVYEESRNLDYLSSFGGVVVLNQILDFNTAKKIGESFIEVIAAPHIEKEALDYFSNLESKQHVRIVELGDLHNLPKYEGDQITNDFNLKMLVDGSILLEKPFLKLNLRKISYFILMFSMIMKNIR